MLLDSFQIAQRLTNPFGGIYLIIISVFILIAVIFAVSKYKYSVNRNLIKMNRELIAAHADLTRLNKKFKKKIKKRTRELEQSRSFIQATLESTMDGILVVDLEGKQIGFNNRFATIWNIPSEILACRNDEIVMHLMLNQLNEPEKFQERLKFFYDYPAMEGVDEIRLKDGRIFERIAQPQWLHEHVVGRVWAYRDITNRKKLEDRLEYQATYDMLTDLPNRSYLLDHLNQAILNARRFEKTLVVFFIDLDRFKLVNDSLGHDMGDALLRKVAMRLKEHVRGNDILVRLGGDEFVLFAHDLENDEAISAIAQSIQRCFAEPFNVKNNQLTVSSSIGISKFPLDGNTATELLKNADAAMYRAKEIGRNNFQYYTEKMNSQTLSRIQLENELRLGLEFNEFALVYQPLINLKTGLVQSVEALIRWRNASRGLILPQEFISLAEETGMILPIGGWVLHEACKQIKKWQMENVPPIRVSVNLSSRQLKQGEIVKTIKNILERTELNPDYLELELTESVIMEHTSETIEIMRGLRNLGVRLAIDDFGTGYSSLSYLKQFPINTIKIDRSFIKDIETDAEDTAIIKTIIELGKALNLRVVAEGVETKNQLEFLRLHNCDEVQGFIFSQPLSAENCAELIIKKSKF